MTSEICRAPVHGRYKVAQVAVENSSAGFDKEYSYLLPENLAETALPGCRCTVPFGGGNKKRTGIILETGETSEPEKLKPVYAVIDPSPMLGGEGLFMLRYIRETTFCTWFDALGLLIPAGMGIAYQTVYALGETDGFSPFMPLSKEILEFIASKRSGVEESALCGEFGISSRDACLTALVDSGVVVKTVSTKRRVADDKQIMVRLTGEIQPAALTPKQKKAFAFLEEADTASLKELCYYASVTRTVVDGLVKKGVAEYFECVRPRTPYSGVSEKNLEAAELSDSQKSVYDGLLDMYSSGDIRTALLHGVTGSGKTEVFLKLVEQVVNGGRTAIVMVPEISLTAQAVESFRARFGGRVAVLHSGLSLGERMDEWRRIREGGADVVVGTRSAVFAPLENIGLIVIDEEQEHTYKSDKSPRYHARDVALVRCSYNSAMLLLSSATPSMESYHAAKTGKYRLFTLEERFNRTLLPDVDIIDMREPTNVSAYPSLSAALLEELHDNLARGEQSILLLNRRGHSTLVKCSSCGAAAECPNCSVALTYHNANDSLMCHYCGYSLARVDARACGGCGSSLIRYAGIGTQKLEEELTALFPQARLLRVDMDTTMSKFSHEKLFNAFAAGEYDIMLGTQMVAKGLNFPNVTLVGVLQADQSLYSGDFRSFERTFSLLTQVVGRSGRGDKRGRACVQTYSPDNPVIMLAANQDYPAFYDQEIKLRSLHLYPPFCTLCSVGFTGESLEEVQKWADRFTGQFKLVAGESYPDLPVRLLGPSPADIPKAAGKYRYRLLVKCKNTKRTRQMLRQLLNWFLTESRKVGIFIDMHHDR